MGFEGSATPSSHSIACQRHSGATESCNHVAAGDADAAGELGVSNTILQRDLPSALRVNAGQLAIPESFSHAFTVSLPSCRCEMLYILDQRLKAQNITAEKSCRVLHDVVRTMFDPDYVKMIFTPQEVYSVASTRKIFERLAHSSIMRLSESRCMMHGCRQHPLALVLLHGCMHAHPDPGGCRVLPQLLPRPWKKGQSCICMCPLQASQLACGQRSLQVASAALNRLVPRHRLAPSCRGFRACSEAAYGYWQGHEGHTRYH